MQTLRTNNRFSLLLTLPMLALLFLAMGCGSNGATSDGDEIPYEVGEPVTDSTVALVVSSDYGTDTIQARQYQQQAQMRLQKLPPDQRNPDTLQSIHRRFVRSFAGRHAMRGQAEEEGIEVDSAKVTSRLEQIKKRYKSEAQLKKQLAQNNMTLDSLRRYLADQLRTQAMQEQMVSSAEEPTESEVEAYSKENRRIRAQHILIKVGENAPEAKVDSARKVAEALLDSVQSGANFSELARRHSDGPSAKKGGDLGFFTKNQMVDEFADAAYALSDSGDVAPEPVRTRFGFHVIRLTNAGEPMDTSKARKQMMQERRRTAFDEELNKLLQDVTVRANPDIVEAGLYEDQ